jgi:enamine deaminase RidA (YjgF/YER057c/UK114 family)
MTLPITGRIEARLAELDITLPTPGRAVANFVPCVLSGRTLYISGQVPFLDGAMVHPGQVGREVGMDEAKAAARLCGLNALSQARAFLGDLERISRIVMVHGFVNSAPDFTQHPTVMNGVSDLLVEVFGEVIGRHARFAVGASSLPFNAPVEVAIIAEVAA